MTFSRDRLACAAALLGLSACAQNPRLVKSPPGMIQPVGNAQQISDVVAALEGGDVKAARKLLKKMARRDPSDAKVRTLIASIDTDPVALLGAKSFMYPVQRGDRMTSLAQRFLGDRLKFFFLVRYNGFNNAQLTQGQVIRIPGTAPASPPPTPTVTRARPEPRAQESALPAPRVAPVVPAPPKANPPLAAALRAQALRALDQGKVAAAVVLLRRARGADPANAAVQRDLSRAERVLATVRSRK